MVLIYLNASLCVWGQLIENLQNSVQNHKFLFFLSFVCWNLKPQKDHFFTQISHY